MYLSHKIPNCSYVSYFTDLAEELPDDTLILTLGCAKNRFIRSEKLMNATLSNGMPRILDMGKSHTPMLTRDKFDLKLSNTCYHLHLNPIP